MIGLIFGGDFEVKKKTIHSAKNTRKSMRIPLKLVKLYEKIAKRSITDSIDSSDYAVQKELKNYILVKRIHPVLMQNMFNNCLKRACDHIQSILQNDKLKEIKITLMVGGFSDCVILKEKIQSSLPDYDVLIPDAAASMIMKGAML